MEHQSSIVILQAFLADPKNREVFGKFAGKYQPRIKECCRRRGLQDADADDLTASLLLGFCERDLFAGFVLQNKEKFNRWLGTVVKHAVLTFLRDRARKPDSRGVGGSDSDEFLQRVTEGIAPDLEMIYAEDRARVAAAYTRVQERVEEKTWRAFCMVVDEERTVEEVTAHLRMSKLAVWQAVSRVKRKLRDELSDLHDPAGAEP